jgi:hypothetical protein
MNHQEHLKALIEFFNNITIDSANHISDFYTADAYFKDPFNEVRGVEKITPIFTHMFAQVDGPRFVVTGHVLQDEQAFLTWNFLFRMKRFSTDEQCIRGATHIRFANDGRVEFHRDYWDAAEELYEKLPVLGALMRGLKRMAQN